MKSEAAGAVKHAGAGARRWRGPGQALCALLVMGACESKTPYIGSISPRGGIMGDVVTVFGGHFGRERNESYITVGGIVPTSSAYLEWDDARIVFKTPELGESGLIYVHRGDKRSNAALFANQAVIPARPGETEPGIEPRILAVRGSPASIGQAITITGRNFGAAREDGGVFFTWDVEPPRSAPAESQGPFLVEVSARDFGYELWSEREIRVRVPDGAASGSIEVRTSRGERSSELFEIAPKPGTKSYRDKRSYAISYGVDVQVQEASSANTLYLWVPLPADSASQRAAERLSRNREPFFDNHRGTSLFKLTDLTPGRNAAVVLSYLVEVYTVETAVRGQQIKAGSRTAPLETACTQPAPLIPSNDPAVVKQAAAITGRDQNPYSKAQRIYQWLVTEGGIQAEPLPDVPGGAGAVQEALEKRRADSYLASLLFCSLARAAGVPAIPVAGVLVDKSAAARRHYWAEFWLEGFGWVPADPALGAGAAPPSFALRPDAQSYYFGNLDNQRIAFSRDQTVLSPMDPRGRTAGRSREYALQNLWEEAAGGLESYSSLWSDVTITGIYAQ